MMRRMKRIFTCIICFVLSANLVFTELVVHAQEFGTFGVESTNVGSNADVAHASLENMEFEANNSLGTMFEAEINDALEKQEESTGYNVFSIEMVDNIAVVDLETQIDSTVVVGIYEESTEKLSATGTLEISNVDEEVYVDMNVETLPQYYYIRAYIVDTETLKPLSVEYESTMYTQEMQEFLQKTVDDFDSDKVLKFEESDETNFGVFSDETIIIPKSESNNEVASVDEENQIYVIENADDYILSLQEGDVFTYEYTNEAGETEILIVKVKSIVIDGTTATITGDETELEEVFEYLKVEEESFVAEEDLEEEYDEDGVEFVGTVEMPDDTQTFASYEGSVPFGFSYQFIDWPKSEKQSQNEAKLNGSLNVGIKFVGKIYLGKSKKYIEIRVDYELEVDINVTGKLSTKGITLKKMVFNKGFMNALSFSCKPQFVFEAEGVISIKTKVEGSFGVRVSFPGGAKILNEGPKSSFSAGVDASIFLGIKMGPKLKVLKGKVANAEITGEAGVKITAEYKPIYEDDDTEKHTCKHCVDGEILGVYGVTIETNVLNIKQLKFKREFQHELKIWDWYWSIDHGEFDLCECPYLTYKTEIYVKDSNNNALSGVKVGEYTTDSSGKIVTYLSGGKHKFTVSKDGYVTQKKTITVDEDTKKVVIKLREKTSGDSPKQEIEIDETTFPDATFRQYVLDYIDTDGDGVLSKLEISGVTEISCKSKNISDLTGVEYFYNLENLSCSYNKLTSLDVSGCTNLEILECRCNNLTSLDVSGCTNLEVFDCAGNSLTSLDMSECTNLENLDCFSNELTSLDVSGCTNLDYLDCSSNKLTSLDMSGCTNLDYLDCGYNNLTSLDVSGYTNLGHLSCSYNNLTNLDVSGCAKLDSLYCPFNNLTSLYASGCAKLDSLYCYYNNLTSLDVSGCTNLETLFCYYNNLTSLDVSGCTNLDQFSCGNNNLTNLDVSGCTNLVSLSCDNNNLTNLGVLGCTKLGYLRCNYNNLTNLDVSGCTNLGYLYCGNNNLTSLDVTGCTDLDYLDCSFNNLTSLDVSECTDLESLCCGNNNLTSLDVTGCIQLNDIECDEETEIIGYNQTTTMNVATYTLSNEQLNQQSTSQAENVTSIIGSTELEIENEPPVLTHQSETTAITKTIHQVTTADDNHVDYTDLYPNEIYNLYVVKESADDIPFGEDVLTSNNLLYIRQYTSDSNGELSIDYLPIGEYENATEILVCSKRRDISEGYDIRISNLIYTGEEQAPTIGVKYGEELLAEGKDYELEGDFYVTDIGDYTVSIKGIGIYEGSVDIGYSVLAPVVNVKMIELTTTELSLEKGDNRIITYTVSPSDATDKTLTWSSSDESVAAVDATGKVTALKAGNATITATAADGSGVSASCIVIVTEPDVEEPEEPTTEEPDEPTTEEPTPDTPKIYPAVNVSYRTHIQSFGWEGNAIDIKTWKSNGTMSGTSGKAKRLEGINIVVNSAEAGKDVDLGIQYTTHCQSYGWLPWSADGDMNGTEGEAKRLEAIKIQLTGADKDAYDVYYRVHAQSYGWLGWAKNGEPSGTAGYAKRLEGIQIVVVKKGESFNQKMEGITSAKTEAYIAKEGSSPIVNYPATSNTNPVIPGADTPNVTYRTHVQSFGWQGWKYNGQMSGTSGLAKRLEGININLTNKPCDGDIVYTTHIQSYGWKDGKPEDTTRATWKKNGEMSGTSGEAKRLEAICIDLTGEMAEKYDIYYRVHAQSFGWLGWAKNGEESGTAGYAKRLEGIQIVLVPKGGAAPANNYGGVTSARTEAYIAK